MSDRAELTGAVIASRYRLDAVLRGGADSTSVFEATDLRDAVAVVVRLITTDSTTDGFKQGILAVSGIVHPVLVSPLDWGETTLDGTSFVYIVTERIAGVSLRELLDRGRRLSASQAVVIALDLCRALHHLHQLGVVHGDVRPANVFVTAESRARLAGLGTKGSVGGASTMSIEQARYAAPEFASDATPTAASDVYALALTMLETLTGDVPFAADSTAVTLANRAGRLLPVSADIGPVAVPIEKAARPEPTDRSTALEFGQSLAAIAAKMSPPKPLEALSGESFRESITRTLEAVAAEPAPAAVAPVVAAEATPPSNVDVVIAPPPAERRRYGWIRTAAIIVAVAVSGVLVWQALSTSSNEVPDLVGVPEGEARNQLALFNWSILIRAERSDDVDFGEIIRTIPSAGSMLREGDDITLVVSEGATLAVLPDVTGQTRDDAVATLTAQGLVPVETAQDSDTVPAGLVVSWIVTEQPNLEPGSQVLKGTEVTLAISAGPSLRAMPELVGMTEADALAKLAELQLVGQRGDDVIDTALPSGTVASQAPPAGEQLTRGATVVYALSADVPTVSLPRVVGLTLRQAVSALTNAGLKVAEPSGSTTGRVREVTQFGATIEPGSQVRQGSTVSLVFS